MLLLLRRQKVYIFARMILSSEPVSSIMLVGHFALGLSVCFSNCHGTYPFEWHLQEPMKIKVNSSVRQRRHWTESTGSAGKDGYKWAMAQGWTLQVYAVQTVASDKRLFRGEMGVACCTHGPEQTSQLATLHTPQPEVKDTGFNLPDSPAKLLS